MYLWEIQFYLCIFLPDTCIRYPCYALVGRAWFFLNVVVRVCACHLLVSCLQDVVPYEDKELMIRTMILLGELIVYFCVESMLKTVACDELMK